MNGFTGIEIGRKDRIVGLFSQAHSLAISGDYKEALRLYDRIIADVPDLAVKTPLINYERALCLKALGRIGQAEQAVCACLAAKPDYPDSLRLLSEIRSIKKIGDDVKRRLETQPGVTIIDNAEQAHQLLAEVKTFLPLVEEADVRQALKAISLIEKRIIGRYCGDIGDKALQYLSIVQFVRATSSKTVDSIEIGTLFGGSCLAQLFAMRNLGVSGKIICIYPMSGYYGQQIDPKAGIAVTANVFFENVVRLGFSKEAVDLREVNSNDPRAIEGLREKSYATLLIDGDHSYKGVRHDWENYSRFVSDNGIVLFDDYANRAWPDIGIFVNELKGSLPRGWRELGCLGTTLLLNRSANNGKESGQEVDKDKIYQGLNKCYFSEQCHEKEIIEHLPELLDGVEVFVDVGASLGQYTFFANKHMNEGKIFAIEADSIRFEELKRNCRKWECLSSNKLTALFAAICEKDGKETFYATNSTKSGGLFKRAFGSESANWCENVVDSFRLDSLFKESSPDFVKIDVEGAELRVLKGATRILSEGKTRFLIEVHSGVDPEGQKNPAEVFKFMESFGYSRTNFHGRSLFFKKGMIKENVSKYETENIDITMKELQKNFRTVIIDLGLETVSTRSASDRLNALEVGCMFKTNEGFSTFRIAHFIQQLRGKKRFISIDCDSEHIDACKKMLLDFTPGLLSEVKFLSGHSLEMLPKALDEMQSVDFALLDGGAGPECYLREFELVVRSLSKNGLVVIDDLQDMAPTEAYPFPRLFGKGTLILPYMVIAEYMKVRDISRSKKGNISADPTKASSSGLIAQTPSSELLNLLGNLGYLIISKGRHKMMVVGQRSILESFRCQLAAKRLSSVEIVPTGMFVDASSNINPDNDLGNAFAYSKSLSCDNSIITTKEQPHATRRNLEIFANKYVGRRAFIIGNGPSLNNMDLTKLKDEITFGVNNIFYLIPRMGFKPTFYVVEDKLVAEDRAEEINALTGMIKIFGTELQYCLKDSQDLIWTNVIYDFSNYPDFPHFSEDASQCLWVGGTVSYLCMQLAYYMGFSEVYLVGFDHNYVIPADANVDGTIITSVSDDPNHFHPGYFGKGRRWHDPQLDRMKKAYTRAKEVFEAHRRNIFNATVGGKLEIFPRVNYESLFARHRKEADETSNPANVGYGKDSAIAIDCGGKVQQIQNHIADKTITTPRNPQFSHLVLDYTRMCNSRCTYCGIWRMKDGPELSLEAIERLFFSLSSFGLSTCYVTGGEPYISDKVVDIARLLHKYLPKCRLSGATNGIQPTKILERIQKILDIGVPLEVHVSINGGEATHDATRGGPGFWKKAVYLLETLKSAGVPVVASMSLMPQTIADLPYMQEFCAQRGVRLMFSWVRQWERYGSVDKQYSTWPENLKPRLKEIEYLPDTFDCPGLSKRLVVTPDGSVYPCEVYHPEILLGNVNKESLECMLSSPRANAMTQMICTKNCHWCQGEGEHEGSPKWMLMDCYRRHSKQCAYMAEHSSQAVHMSLQESRRVIENILSHKSLHQIPASIGNENTQADGNSKSRVRISAIICTYRDPELLSSTIKSLLNQTLRRDIFEIIVIDNNSGDSTKQVVDHYPEVRYVFEENLGLSHARNAGIQAARSDIIAFIDDDAQASAGWLETLLKIYEAIPDAWAVGGKVLPIWDAVKPDWITEDKFRQLSLVDWGDVPRPLRWPERIIGTNCSFRRQVFSDIGFFNTGLGRIGTVLLGNEDTEIQQRIHALGHLVYYSPDAVVHHHVPASRMTREYFKRRSEGTIFSQNIMTLRSQGKDQEVEKENAEIRRKLELSNFAQKQQQVLNASRELLSQYKNSHRGQRCVIIGNGPSLNKMDLSFLKNEITFGMNRIYLMFDKWDFRPSYYVSVNPLVIEQSADQIRKITSPKFLGLNGLPYIQNHRDTIFLQSIRRPSFSKDPRNGLWEGHTVTYVAMQLAYFMGFSEVILIGVDHYFKSQGPANKEVISEGDDQNHFHPHYFGKGVRWNLPDLAKSEVAYSLAKQAFEADGRRIVDATVDGHLTIFPKADYKQIFLPASLTANSGELGLNAALIDTEFEEYVRDKNENLNITVRPKFDPLVPAEPHRRYLVSAIVSTYNSERFLRGCLDDLEQQTIADKIEIIVINSGSQENEEAIVREYWQKYNNIIYIKTEQRETLYTAWNRAIKAASGKFITTANTDDRHRKDAFEALSNALQEYPDVSLVYGDCYVSTKPNENYEENSKSCIYHYPEFLAVDAVLFNQFGPQPMWRKNVHETIGYFDESYKAAGDHDFNIRFAMHFEALHIDEPLGLYLKHSEAISFKDNTMRQEQQRIVFDYRKPEIVEKLYRRVGITADTAEEKAKVFLDMGVRAMECYPPWKAGRAEHHLEFAFQCFNKAAEFRPDWAAAYNNLAVVLGLSGNLGGAGKLLEKAADMTQDSTISFNLKLISDSLPSIQFSSGAKLLLSGLSLPSQKEVSLKWKLSEPLTQTFLSLPQGNVRSNLEYWQQLQDNQYFEKHQYYAGLKAYGTDCEKLGKYTSLSKEMTVVVIGCGYGRETLLIAPRVKHVYGIDVNRTILDKADKFLAERGITNFTSVLAQDWKRVVPSNIDVVYSIVVFQHLTRYLVKDYVHGLAKKLSPNGKFVCQFADLANGTHDAELRPYEPNTRWSQTEIEELIQECGLIQNAIDTQDIPGKGSWYWAFFGKQGARRPAAKILFYFDRIGNLNKISSAGTVIAILNFARALQSSNPDVKIHITGDLVSRPEQYESFEILPLPSADERRKFLAEYDSVFFATHVRYFKGLTKPSGQIWVLWQHCWEADDRVSLSHSSDFDVVMCLSEQHRSSLRNKYFGDEKFITIPNLIDTNVYSPKGIIRNNHSIMFAGGLNPHKCVHILLDAFRLVRQHVKDAELHIYGDGKMWRGGDTYGNELKSIKPEGTYFHGYVDNKDMPQIYSKHSILCLPSKLESFGLVTVEAQACGCVPVVHNVGGVAAALADGETGLLYSPNTPEKLAEIIIKALKIVDADPSVRQKAINFVRNTFSINRAAEYISQLWDKINIAKKVNTIRTLLKGNEIEQADLKCKELLQEYPNDPDVLLSQVLIMLQQGNKPKANVAIGKLLENFPNHLRALNDCGLTAMKAGDTEKALRYLTKAYKFNPWDKDTVTNCYAMLKTSGRYRDAKILLLNYLTNVGEDAQVLQLFREIDNLIANAGSGTKVVSQEVLNNRQDVYCESNASLPLVSIITPVYNGADYIGQTIESVFAQDYPNFELVIIDDGSTDNTKEVILRYNDGRIRYLYQENKGVSSARNLAIKKAKGQYIMPLDSDDMMTPDFIAKHLAEFEKHPEVDLVYCDVLLIDGSSNPVRIMNKLEYQDRRHLIRDLFRAGHPVVPFRLGIRRSVFDKIGFYDEGLLIGEDYDMMRRFVKAGLKAHHLSEPLHLRRMHADSLSRDFTAQKAKSHFDVVRRFTDTFTYDELFPDVAWDKIVPEMRQLHAKCLAAGTYLAIGREYIKTNATEYSRTAFDQACLELNDCLKIDPENQRLQKLLQKSELIRARYTEAPQQVVSK